MTRSILYKKKKQGRRKKDILVKFDWDKHEAQYSNYGKKRAPVAVLPGSLDPLSAFYAFRVMELAKGKEFERAVTDGKKCLIESSYR